MCVTSEPNDNRCFELRKVCPDYIFVAVYAPNFPKVNMFIVLIFNN